MTPEEAVEAFGRGIAQGLIAGSKSSPSPRQPRTPRARAPAVHAPAVHQQTLEQPLPFEPDSPLPPTVRQPTTAELEEIDAILQGKRVPTGHYVPEESDGTAPWMSS